MQEVFGPVLTMQTFATDDEAVDLANGTEFGLAAVVVSGDRVHAKAITDRLVAGTIWVNCFFVRDLRAPFGGLEEVRHRPRGRHLVVRFLRGREEHRRCPNRMEGLTHG